AVSDSGRAPKNEPAIMALAMCLKLGDAATRAAAREAVPKVCRIGTHIFALAEIVNVLGGWGRGTRRAFSDWYNGQTPERLALNLLKYPKRNGWSHDDVLRLAHPQPGSDAHAALFRYLRHG